jgi:hypothetical protein
MPGYRQAWQVGDNLQPFDAHPEFEENLGHFILGHFRFLHGTKVLIEFIQELCSQCLQRVSSLRIVVVLDSSSLLSD